MDDTNEAMAAAEAAFAIELASSAALQALCATAPKEVVKMTWLLGYVIGRRDAFAYTQEMLGGKAPA